MKITWYGTASILIETEKTALIFDPYLKDLPKGKEPKEKLEARLKAFKKQKNVLITHGHFDHLASIKELYKSEKDCKIYLTKTPYKTLTKRRISKQNLTQIKPGDRLDFEDISVTIYQGKHIEYVKSELRKYILRKNIFKCPGRMFRIGCQFVAYPEKNETLFYELIAEGKRIQIMGSADLPKDANFTPGADVLILPHQGRRDIDEHNKVIVEKLKPKHVFLDHYDDAFPPFTYDVPVEDFCAATAFYNTEKLIEGKTIEI